MEPAPALPPAPFPRDSVLLHALRTAALRGMPYRPRTMVSVGCAGTWFFDWLHAEFHRPTRHVGIEFFAPRPPDLPDNVEWVADTASRMPRVGDASADLVFSGQNLEHLLPDEIADFFLETARILRPGGVAVLDSPNRAITAALCCAHPEHFIEFTLPEVEAILGAAGFRVLVRRGLWLCRDAAGALLPADAVPDAASLVLRCLDAGARPESSMLWWVEAERLDAPADAPGVCALVAGVIGRAWPERQLRFRTLVGRREDDASGSWFAAPASADGMLMFGPYLPLLRGEHAGTFLLRRENGGAAPGAPPATLEVLAGAEHRVLWRRELPADAFDGTGEARVGFVFTLPDTTFGLQFRVIAHGRAALRVRRDVELRAAIP